MRKLEEKVAIVTGAGSGIGFAIATLFADQGATVVVAELSEERGRKAEALLKSRDDRSFFVQTDVSRWEDIDHLVSHTVSRLGKLDIMVNNAGISDGHAMCLETSEMLFDKVLGINLKGTFFGCRRALIEMVKHDYGKIINVASVASLRAKGGGTAYTASKHAVLGLTRQIACEYGPSGIRINAVCPGPIATDLPDNSGQIAGTAAPATDRGLLSAPPEQIAEIIPLGSKGLPEDVARAALFLACSDSDFVTGHALVVDGGRITK